MREIKSRGFNAIRIPFALDSLVWHTRTSTGVPHLVTTPPSGIVYNLKDDGAGGKGASYGNQEFCNVTPSGTGTCSNPKYPAQILEKMLTYAAELDLRVILDLHLLNAGAGRYDAKDDTSDEANRNPTSKPYPIWFLSDGSCTAAAPCGPPSDPNTNLEASFTEARTINTWENIAVKFKGFRAIVGADLYNEPFGFEGHNINGDSLTEPWACWPGGGTVCNTGKARNWPAAAERMAEKIFTASSNKWLIFVEGVQHTPNRIQDPNSDSYSGPFFGWGSNLYNVRYRRVNLPVANKLVYSAHDYPNGVYCAAWLRGRLWDGAVCPNGEKSAGFPNNLPEVWDRYWGFIYKDNIAPVFLGEFGTLYNTTRDVDHDNNSATPPIRYDLPQDRAWLRGTDASYTNPSLPQGGLVKYLKDNPWINWAFWSWNLNSEPGGILGGCVNKNLRDILNTDWDKVHWDKLNAIRTIMFPSRSPTSNDCP